VQSVASNMEKRARLEPPEGSQKPRRFRFRVRAQHTARSFRAKGAVEVKNTVRSQLRTGVDLTMARRAHRRWWVHNGSGKIPMMKMLRGRRADERRRANGRRERAGGTRARIRRVASIRKDCARRLGDTAPKAAAWGKSVRSSARCSSPATPFTKGPVLSGGERQRDFALATVLARPSKPLLDGRPTSRYRSQGHAARCAPAFSGTP